MDNNMVLSINSEGKKVLKKILDGDVAAKGRSDMTYHAQAIDKIVKENKYVHPEKHNVSEITGLSSVATSGNSKDLKGNPWKLLYVNQDGNVSEIGLGASGQILKSNGAEEIPSWRNITDYSGWKIKTNGGETGELIVANNNLLTINGNGGTTVSRTGSTINISSTVYSAGTGIVVSGSQIKHDDSLLHVPAKQSANSKTFLRNDNTWQQLPTASVSDSGLVQLNDSLNNPSTTLAATANSVKKVNDMLSKKAEIVISSEQPDGNIQNRVWIEILK